MKSNRKIRKGQVTTLEVADITGLQTSLDTKLTIATSSPQIPTSMWFGTQVQYDAIITKDFNTIYNIV